MNFSRWFFPLMVLTIFLASSYFDFIFPNISHAWQQLDQGLWLGEFESPQKSVVNDSKVMVLKVDPDHYSFRLLCSGEQGTGPMTADQWAKKFNLVAVINASMYLGDHKSSTGYMKNFDYVNNATINKKFGAFMVFNPVENFGQQVQIIDRYNQGWKTLITKYHTVIQNYRMISIKQNNVWSQKDNIYSIACVGMDKEGNVLFILCRAPYSVHDLNNILLQLPLNIYSVMYVEGGPEASLYVKTDSFTGSWMGSYETGFWDDSNKEFWKIPNVIGVVKK